MEIVSSGGAVNYQHVTFSSLVNFVLKVSRISLVIIAHLQISLNSARRMLRAISIVTVRQKQNKTILDTPLLFS